MRAKVRRILYPKPVWNRSGAIYSPGHIETTGTSVGTNAGNGRLLCAQYISPPGAFIGVRLMFLNHDTAASCFINACAVAPAAASLTNGNTLTWTDVTFNNGVSHNCTVPAAISSTQRNPGIVMSDFIPVSSIARSDGGVCPMLQVRTHYSDSASVAAQSTGANEATIEVAAYNTVKMLSGWNDTTALVGALKTTSLAPIQGYAAFAPQAVEFVYAPPTKVYGVSVHGDSLVAGTTYTIGGDSPWGMRVQSKAFDAGLKLSTAVFAQSGQTYEDTIRIARAHLAVYKPTFMAFAAWSVNSGTTAADFDRTWALCQDLVARCFKAGVVPVVWQHAPDNNIAGIPTQNARIRNLLPAEVCKPDFYTPLQDGGTPNTLLAAYWGDGIGEHYNDAGHDAAATAFLSAITPFCT